MHKPRGEAVGSTGVQSSKFKVQEFKAQELDSED